MFALLLVFAVQPGSALFGKLDEFYNAQVSELKKDIEIARSNPQLSAKLRQDLVVLQRTYAIAIPLFDFGKGVREGDVGTIGFYMDSGIETIPNAGSGGVARVSVERKVVRQAKVVKIDGEVMHLSLLPKGSGSVIVKGINDKTIAEEKVIMLHKYIYQYEGKESGQKVYRVIGGEPEFLAWKKYRAAKK